MTVSKYQFIDEQPGQFRIEAVDRTPVTIRFTPGCIEVHAPTWAGEKPELNSIYNLYNYHGLSRSVARLLMSDWHGSEKYPYAPKYIMNWAYKQTGGAIGKRLYQRWQEALSRTDPNILAIHKAVFTTCFGMGLDTPLDIFAANHYAAQDITNYRGAAAAAGMFDTLVTQYVMRQNEDIKESVMFLKAKIPLTPFVRNWNNYPVLLSDTGEPYRALTSTLTNLPGGVPASLLTNLLSVHLERPFDDRTELTALLAYISYSVSEASNTAVFMNASKAQIYRSIELLGQHLHEKLSGRRAGDIEKLTVFLRDYPERHTGNLLGLTKKAIQWHAHQLEQNRQRMLAKYGGDQELARPPIDLPNDPAIRLITNVSELVTEGQTMDHCVASYAEQAINGGVYVFHVKKNGEHATIALNPNGGVIQANGPRNQTNRAARWGKSQLTAWGKAVNGHDPILPKMLAVEKKEPVSVINDPLFGRIELMAMA